MKLDNVKLRDTGLGETRVAGDRLSWIGSKDGDEIMEYLAK